MLTKTSLIHPKFLNNIKQAITLSIKTGRESVVKNKRGHNVLAIIHVGNGKWRACDKDRNDVSEVVMCGLRDYFMGEKK